MISSRKTHLITAYAKSISGAALVEMSLLILPLMALMVGAVEYGRVFQQYHVASKGVTAASRYLARVQIPNLCPGTTWPDSVSAGDAKDLAQRGILEQGNGATASHILPNWTNHNQITISISCQNNPNLANGISTYRGPSSLPRVVVSTTFTYDQLGLFSLIDTDGVQITASHTELHIGG